MMALASACVRNPFLVLDASQACDRCTTFTRNVRVRAVAVGLVRLAPFTLVLDRRDVWVLALTSYPCVLGIFFVPVVRAPRAS